MAETCRCFGKRAVAATIAPGKSGAREKPRNETNMAEARKDGMSQKQR